MKLLALLLLPLALWGVSPLGVPSPYAPSLDRAEQSQIWHALEKETRQAGFENGVFRLVASGELLASLQSAGLSEGTDYLTLTDNQRAAVKRIQGVRWLLASKITPQGQFRLLCQVAVVECASGRVVAGSLVGERFGSVDDLTHRLSGLVSRAVSRLRGAELTAILPPVVLGFHVPPALPGTLSRLLRERLLKNRIPLVTEADVLRHLRNEGVDASQSLLPSQARELCQSLQVRRIVIPQVNLCSLQNAFSAPDAWSAHERIRSGTFSLTIRIINENGMAQAIPTAMQSCNFSELPGGAWSEERCVKHLVDAALGELLPQVLPLLQ